MEEKIEKLRKALEAQGNVIPHDKIKEQILYLARVRGCSIDEIIEIVEQLNGIRDSQVIVITKGASIGPSETQSIELLEVANRKTPLSYPSFRHYFEDDDMTPKEYGKRLQGARNRKRR